MICRGKKIAKRLRGLVKGAVCAVKQTFRFSFFSSARAFNGSPGGNTANRVRELKPGNANYREEKTTNRFSVGLHSLLVAVNLLLRLCAEWVGSGTKAAIRWGGGGVNKHPMLYAQGLARATELHSHLAADKLNALAHVLLRLVQILLHKHRSYELVNSCVVVQELELLFHLSTREEGVSSAGPLGKPRGRPFLLLYHLVLLHLSNGRLAHAQKVVLLRLELPVHAHFILDKLCLGGRHAPSETTVKLA